MVNAFETFPHLLAPLKVGNVVFRNHMFCAPTGHTDLTETGQPSMDAIMYFERKAMGGAATVVTGEVNVDPEVKQKVGRWPRDINRKNNYNFPRLASTISRHGAVPVLELQFEGGMSRARHSDPEFKKTLPWGVMDLDNYNGFKVRAMTDERIMEVIKGYGVAALNAKKAGFQMVCLHASHGWGLQQFMSPTLNKREDQWGGSVENRCRFPVMAIDEIHRVCGRNFPVEIRISGSEIVKDGFDVDEACRIAEQLDGHADIIHVSVGSVFSSPQSFSRTHVTMFYPQGINVQYAAEIKKHVKQSLVGTLGGLSDPYFMEDVLASGKADIVYMARELICDPDMPNKVRLGKVEDIRKCMRCMNCFSSCMSRGDFICALNPEISRERENYYGLPPAKKQKVLVIGGGISGMQAALTAAKEGHEVVLCEKSGELGGGILCEKDVPFKERLHEYIEYQKRQIAKTNIDLRMNTLVTPEYARNENADVILAAIGSTPITPKIAGIDGANVHQAMNVYVNPDLAQGKVMVLGAGLVGIELAFYLISLGREVEIIEMTGDMNDGGNTHHRMAVEDWISKTNLQIHYNTKAVEITDKGVKCEGPDGEVFYNADTVVHAVGMRPLQEEALAFDQCAPMFRMIGDCVSVANIANATGSAYTMAKMIGRFSFCD